MIDFNTTQLTWILIGACSVGGTGYLSINNTVHDINTKLEVNNQQIDQNNKQIEKLIVKMEELNITLTRNNRDK